MKNLTVIDDSSLSYAESFVKNTILDLKQIERTFFKIGFRLNEAVREQYYLTLGYKDIFELAEKEFGFKTTTTKNLMLVNKTYSTGYYSCPSMEIADKYKKYSQTQLVEMLPLGPSQREKVSETWTARDIRDYKKITSWNFDGRKCGLPESWSTIPKNSDPKIYINIYRENLEKSKTSSVSQLTEKKNVVPAPEDIPAGQLYLGADESITEFHQSGAEQFSQSTDQRYEFVPMLEESQSTDQEPEDVSESVQEIAPEPKKLTFKNRGEREAFIDNKDNFPILVLESEELGLTVRRLDFINGVKLYRSDHVEFNEYTRKFQTIVKFHLVDDREKSKPLKKANVMPGCVMTFTLAGTARTYVVDYMTRYANEI